MSGSVVGESSSLENILTPIVEDVNLEVRAPESVPKAFVTVERAAIAKIFLERYYEKLYSCHITPRSIRRHQVELFLYRNQSLSALEKGEIRQSLARDESEHLRHLRVMKSRKRNSIKEQDIVSSAYDVIKILGKGSFGVVRLVKEKYNDLNVFDSNQDPQRKRGNVCAMKVIRKSNMLQNSQEGHLHAERDFFVAAEGSRWIVPLITSFQDMENLYLVMEYMPGGDFLGLLIRENVLSEPVTKWYIAEIILCIEEAHNLHWIHRDIKPDNFLISASGHLKISDFGLAFDGHWSHDQSYFNNHRYSLITKLGLKVDGDSIDKQEGNTVAAAMKTAQMMMSGKVRHEVDTAVSTDSGGDLNWRNKNSNRSFARSVVGTSQYMAPEVVRGEIYDARCDWWSMAIILYECLYGHTPFIAEDGSRQQTKSNIVNHRSEFKFPQRPVVSRKCQDFIRSVIQEKENRLCSRKYRIKESQGNGKHIKDPAGQYVYPNDAEDIKAHKWFRDIQWDRLHLMIPPVVPKLKSLDDTCYFDDEGSVSDFSESVSETPYSQEDIVNILEPFNSEIKTLTQEYLELPYDSTRLKEFEKKIDQFPIVDAQKQNLKKLVKLNGRKERKRPRDILLRDKSIGPKVLKIRKEGAFLGYTYRRFNPGQYNVGGIFRRNRSSTFKRSKINCVS
ncbi:putative serine threonine-protein kinase cbk1 [Erysiphe necator]|uniref:non-specific serine/threonine protein kinase n=1 Tax=Uncinula necator TaxID=52586 RepID=A0A0B1P6W8_UNCNE|nr:putative serine threonine-protein kinase cbk1 [Erysiphe necator]